MKREPEDLLESSPYHGSMVHGRGHTDMFRVPEQLLMCRKTAAAISPQLFYVQKNVERKVCL